MLFHLFAQTLLDCNTTSGELSINHVPELLSDEFVLAQLRLEYKAHFSGTFYRLLDFNDKFYQDADGDLHSFKMCYTPTLSYRDFSLAIKNFRIDYQRKVGPLDFKYICVGEYGSKRSRRPHFHCLFFGLDFKQVEYFCRFWKYGFHYIEQVKYKNDDGSDGLAKVSSYIGKYAAKGSFVPDSVTSGFTIPCRVSSSRGVGLCNLDNFLNYYRCYDISVYDIEKMDMPEDKHDIVILECFNRLKQFNYVGCKRPIPLPLSLKKKIFGYRVIDGKAIWSRLYYEVMDFARVFYQAEIDRAFKRFYDDFSRQGFTASEICSTYEALQDYDRKSRESRERSALASFYAKSKYN